MSSAETQQQGGQPHLQKQDLATLVRRALKMFANFCGLASLFLKFETDELTTAFLTLEVYNKPIKLEIVYLTRWVHVTNSYHSTHAISEKIEKFANLQNENGWIYAKFH